MAPTTAGMAKYCSLALMMSNGSSELDFMCLFLARRYVKSINLPLKMAPAMVENPGAKKQSPIFSDEIMDTSGYFKKLMVKNGLYLVSFEGSTVLRSVSHNLSPKYHRAGDLWYQ
ncbi:hypothetical protein OGAPHI_002427 [Ogataea philodendri]|uniref:Uncharacterized protein n=1 Tax=Ogataea philodendri TaxID=1378263 RepID=A0A9P8T715_9ASCO|nr:uncharacterized protein OGAPHI_002427 [Ogataea philodendri]KAH3668673.1 hypothetical protein OGAPHI_002427 [Ogataea philodendri]